MAGNTYWTTHAALVEDNTITKGRGRGGSVSLTASSDNATRPIPSRPARPYVPGAKAPSNTAPDPELRS